jgi:ATP-dependent RNA helicase DDX19/DBP5
MSSDLQTEERDSLFARFRAGGINILVCTNLAERGIDLAIVNLVINLDCPCSRTATSLLSIDPAEYLHRVGRTGRMGRKGVAITFVEDSIDTQALQFC